VGHQQPRGRLITVSRVPIRGTLPRGSDQVTLSRDLEDLGRASRVSLISRPTRLTPSAAGLAAGPTGPTSFSLGPTGPVMEW